jgi:TRAP-type C4-dicarboxylate transport system permease small subunit
MAAEAGVNLVASLKRISRAVNRTALLACVACVLAMLSISFTGFFYTLSTGEALSWTYSLARLFIPWIGMLSITVAFHAGEHVSMTMVSRLIPDALATAFRYLVLATVALFALMLLWFGWHFFASTTQYYMVSDQLQVHGRWVAASVPVSGAILLVHLINGVALLDVGTGVQTGTVD